MLSVQNLTFAVIALTVIVKHVETLNVWLDYLFIYRWSTNVCCLKTNFKFVQLSIFVLSQTVCNIEQMYVCLSNVPSGSYTFMTPSSAPRKHKQDDLTDLPNSPRYSKRSPFFP